MTTLVVVLVVLVFISIFELWELLMNSFVIAVILGILAYMGLSAPWNIVVPIIIGVLWIIYKMGGGGGRFGGDDGGDFGGFDGGGD